MNGEALTKRYEVKDLETGEVLDEPLYVLRPREDAFALSCMYAYCRLAEKPVEEARKMLGSGGPKLDSVSRTPEGLIQSAYRNGYGLVEEGVEELEVIGYELVSLLFRRMPEERVEEAKARNAGRMERRYGSENALLIIPKGPEEIDDFEAPLQERLDRHWLTPEAAKSVVAGDRCAQEEDEGG